MFGFLCGVHASCLINFVDVSLVQVYYKDNIVSKAAYSVHCGHCYDEAKEIIDDGIQESVE